MPPDSHRLSILTPREIDDLYGLPRFTPEDRHLYFDLSPTEREAVATVRTSSTAAHLILEVEVQPADVQDRDGARMLLPGLKERLALLS